MKFKFEDYIGKYAMHCKTEKEAKEFCKVMDTDGRKWRSGASYLSKSCWELHQGSSVYYFNDGIAYFGKTGYTILEWEDFMEFTKDDLKIGYVVEFRNGDFRMVMECQEERVFTSNYGFMRFNDYMDNLSSFGLTKTYDIMKVWGFARSRYKTLIIDTCDRELLYERKEPKELTMQEIADKFGVDVKDLKIKK